MSAKSIFAGIVLAPTLVVGMAGLVTGFGVGVCVPDNSGNLVRAGARKARNTTKGYVEQIHDMAASEGNGLIVGLGELAVDLEGRLVFDTAAYFGGAAGGLLKEVIRDASNSANSENEMPNRPFEKNIGAAQQKTLG